MRSTVQPVLFLVLVNIGLTCVDVLFVIDPSSELSRSRAIKVASELPKDNGIRPSLAVRRQNGPYVFMMAENLNNLTTALETVDGSYDRYLSMVTSEIMRRRHVRPLVILLFSDKEMNTTLVTFWKDLSRTRKIHIFRVGTAKLKKFNELFAKDGKSFNDLIACDTKEQGVVNIQRRSPAVLNQSYSTTTHRLPFSRTTRQVVTSRPVTVAGPKIRPIFRRKDKQKHDLTYVATPPPIPRIAQTTASGFVKPRTTRKPKLSKLVASSTFFHTTTHPRLFSHATTRLPQKPQRFGIHQRFSTTHIITGARRIPTTTKSTTTTQRVPIGCVADVIFLMDFSDSNGNSSKHYLDVAAATIGKLPIAPNAVRVSLIRYSGPGRSETLFHLDKHAKKDGLIEELFRNPITGGTTRTGEAIRHAIKEFANPKYGARKNAQKYIVVFSDGYSQDDPTTASDEARKSGITMLAVAIQDAKVPPNEEELAEITRNRNYVLVSPNGQQLRDKILGNQCNL